MKILELFDSAVSDRLQALIELGNLRYSKSNVSSHKERRSLGVRIEDLDFEIIIWESGEVEFGYGTLASSTEEHLVVSSNTEIDDLFTRFIQLAREESLGR